MQPVPSCCAAANFRWHGMAKVLLCALVPLQAMAQERDAKVYSGTWTTKLQAADGRVRDAIVVIDGYDGTWQERAPKGRAATAAACKGKKVPVTVQSSTQTLLLFTVWGETVAPACQTLTVTLRPVKDTVLEGGADLSSHASETPEVHASHSPAGQAVGGAASVAVASHKAPAGTAGSVRMTRR